MGPLGQPGRCGRGSAYGSTVVQKVVRLQEGRFSEQNFFKPFKPEAQSTDISLLIIWFQNSVRCCSPPAKTTAHLLPS